MADQPLDPFVQEVLRIAQADMPPAQKNAALRIALATRPDPQLERARTTAEAAVTRSKGTSETKVREFGELAKLKREDIESREAIRLATRAAEAEATSTAAKVRLRTLVKATQDMISLAGTPGYSSDAVKTLTDDIGNLTAEVPASAGVAARLKEQAGRAESAARTRIIGSISSQAERAGIVIPDENLQRFAQQKITGENPNVEQDIRQEIQQQQRSRRFERQASKIRTLAGEDQRVIGTIEELIGKVGGAPTSAEAEQAATAELGRIRTKEIPRAQRSARLRTLGKRGAIGGAGALALGAILNSIFGKQETTDAEGLSPEQKFQLAMTLAGNTGIGKGGAGGALQTGRELGNMQKMLALIQQIRQMQGLMNAPQQQLDFV
jgi:hypothetical protein